MNLRVLAAGCIFPSGPGMVLANAALHTGMTWVRRRPFYLDRAGQAVRGSFFPEPTTFNVQRWIELAQAALDDLHAQLPKPLPQHLQDAEFSLWLVIPPALRPGVPAGLKDRLAACGQGPFRFTTVKYVEGGHAAPVEMMKLAREELHSESHVAIVLAVDSWLHADALLWLEGQRQLHNAGVHGQDGLGRNPYGRIPGEAAAAVMIGHAAQGWCQIKGLGLAQEPVLYNNPKPCTGQGWSQAIQKAMEGLPAAYKFTHVMSDLNGEPYRADQFGFAMLRLGKRLVDNWQRHTPALVTGDVGTATGLVQVALSAYMLHKREPWQDAERHLLLSSSDDSLRAALVME